MQHVRLGPFLAFPDAFGVGSMASNRHFAPLAYDFFRFVSRPFEVTQEVETPFGRKFTGKAKIAEEVVQVAAAEFMDSTDAILILANGQKIRTCCDKS